MATIKTNNQYYTDIANAIRSKNGTNTTYKPSEMANTILNMSSGSSSFSFIDLLKCTNRGIFVYNSALDGLFRSFQGETIPPIFISKIDEYINDFTCESANEMFSYCTGLKTAPLFNTSNLKAIRSMFEGCSSLETIPAYDFSNIDTTKSWTSILFSGCSSLKSILMTGMKGSFDISSSTQFAASDLVTILNNLGTAATSTTKLTMGSTNLAKLTDVQKAIATNKGWTLA